MSSWNKKYEGKSCHVCGVILTHDNTCPSNMKRGRGACNPCANKRERRYRVEYPKANILKRTKSRAKLRGMVFTLEEKDIPDIPEFCPVFPWIKLEYKVGEGRSPGSPALDRIINSIGYVKGNVRIISDRANYVKGDATDDELIALGKDALSRQV